jgi:urease accessory protein
MRPARATITVTVTATITTTTTAIRTEATVQGASLLGLLWLASPGLPVGGFAYSEALEAAVDAGVVHDEASAGGWLSDQLQLGLARAELPLLAAAHAAWTAHDAERLDALAGWWLATRETHELRAQTQQMGRSMLELLRLHRPEDDRLATLGALPPAWPIAFALAAVQTGADAPASLLAFGFSWAENQVQAALKAVPLGQSAGQRILARLAAELPPLAHAAFAMPDEERMAFLPLLAIRSAQHETQYSRLFRS